MRGRPTDAGSLREGKPSGIRPEGPTDLALRFVSVLVCGVAIGYSKLEVTNLLLASTGSAVPLLVVWRRMRRVGPAGKEDDAFFLVLCLAGFLFCVGWLVGAIV